MTLLNDLTPISLVALLGVVGNIIYFEYRFKKERHKEILVKKLTNLLLPLYFTLKNDEFVLQAYLHHDSADPYEYESDKPKRLLKNLSKIIKENIYLADDELHGACLMFMEWAYSSNADERFQRMHEAALVEDKILENFRDIVFKKYIETRNKYIG